MATLTDLDWQRPLSIWPARREAITEPVILRLAEQFNDPNLLKLDTLLEGEGVTLGTTETLRLLEWLAKTRWGAVVETDLQGMSQTAAGEPLLSTFLTLDVFQRMAQEAYAAHVWGCMEAAIQRWRQAGVLNVYLDFFEATERSKQAIAG